MIKLINVKKRFENKIIFNNLNFTIKAGQIYILQGSSGVGKTTMLNMIYGYEKDYSGEIKKISDKLKIEYLFQDDLIFNNISVLENMKLKMIADTRDNPDEERIEQILKQFGILDLKDTLTTKLSGGEKQRLKLSQMLLSDPDIILMDEPISNLDKENADIITKLIEEIYSEKTLFIVTHDDLNFNKKVHQLYMKDGQIYEK